MVHWRIREFFSEDGEAVGFVAVFTVKANVNEWASAVLQ